MKGLLLALVVIISLFVIAFMATHIYVRLNKQTPKTLPVEQSSPISTDTIAADTYAKVELLEQDVPIKDSLKSKVHEPGLMGTWVSKSSSSMITFEGTSYTLEMPSVEEAQFITGSFTIIDGFITLETVKGPVSCNNTKGLYTYKLKGDDLSLSPQSDGCKLRSTQLKASFFRLY